MALSVEKLLNDAHTLIVRLKDHDNLADNMISTTQILYNKFEAMKQYQDDITELNEIAKHRPRSTLVLGIAQENRQIRELQQENSELQATLEEHQSALELIMQKYREHTVKLLQSNRLERALQEKESANKDPSVCQLMDKIDEMAGVMQKAIEVDEVSGCVDKERLSQLELENKALREMLEICSTSKERIVPLEMKVPEVAAEEEEDEDEGTDTECETSVLSAPEKQTAPEPEDKDLKTEKDPPAEKEKEKEKGKAVDDKKKKKSPESGRKLNSSPATGARTVGTSKSAGDVRKGRVSSAGGASAATSTVKKSVSSTLVRKETSTLRKSPSTDIKKDTKGKTPPRAGSVSTVKK